ncbi:MAG: DUF3576 domain-containing protein [Alphaproteobacteria bacterium]|nr:DUF3576 domain-containing protein [Alphaproteobacteria bacterium]
MKRLFAILSLVFAMHTLIGCSTADLDVSHSYPQDPEDVRRLRNGKLTGDEGISFGGKKKRGDSGTSSGPSIGVNSYLWRATLDTISFMPLVSADPFGGVIITDWYEDPSTPNERFKLNIAILDKQLNANGVKVSAFKQALDDKHNWRDSAVDPSISGDLENKILTRARELRIKDINSK